MNLVFLPHESVELVRLFCLRTNGAISENKRYQESAGVWSHKKALCLSTLCVTQAEMLIRGLRERERSTTAGNTELS